MSSNPSRQLTSRPSGPIERRPKRFGDLTMTRIRPLSREKIPLRLRDLVLALPDTGPAASRSEDRRPANGPARGEARRSHAPAGPHWIDIGNPSSPKAGTAGPWCLDTASPVVIVRAALEQRADPQPAGDAPRLAYLVEQFCHFHRRFDILDRHAADLMLLQLS